MTIPYRVHDSGCIIQEKTTGPSEICWIIPRTYIRFYIRPWLYTKDIYGGLDHRWWYIFIFQVKRSLFLARLVRLEYLTENSFDTQCRTGYNIVYSVQARFFFYFLWSKGQNFFPTLGGQIIYLNQIICLYIIMRSRMCAFFHILVS
jgi:hypothetical protein